MTMSDGLTFHASKTGYHPRAYDIATRENIVALTLESLTQRPENWGPSIYWNDPDKEPSSYLENKVEGLVLWLMPHRNRWGYPSPTFVRIWLSRDGTFLRHSNRYYGGVTFPSVFFGWLIPWRRKIVMAVKPILDKFETTDRW